MSNIKKRFDRLRSKETEINNRRIRAEADVASIEKSIEKKFGPDADLAKIKSRLKAKKTKLELKLEQGLRKLEDEYLD